MSTKPWVKGLCTAFTAVFAAVFGSIALGTLFATQRSPEGQFFVLRPSRMLLCCLIWTALLLGVAWACKRMTAAVPLQSNKIALGLLALCAVACAGIGWLLMVNPQYDVLAVYEGAQNIAATGTLGAYQDYFYIRPNNMAATALLGFVFRLCAVVGVTNTAAIGLVLNVACITGTFAMVYCVAKQLRGAGFGLFALLVCMSCLPMYAYAAVYYTDTMALPCVMGGIILYLQSLQAQGKRRMLLLGATGLVLGLGVAIKLTVIIVFIALIIHAVLQLQGKQFLQIILAVGLGLVLCMIGNQMLTAHLLPDAQRRANETLPFTHWPMMGLAEDGRWNNADEVFSASFATSEERIEANLEVIQERIEAYGVVGMGKLFARKSMYSFGDGTYNVASMVDDGAVHPNVLHQFVLYEAPHFVLFFYICTALHIVLLLAAAAAAVKDLVQRRTKPDAMFFLRLAFFGLWAFLMLWESNSRYIVHFLPILFLCASELFCENKKNPKDAELLPQP